MCSVASLNESLLQDALEAQMSRMKVQQPTPPAATAPAPASAPAGAAAGIPAAVGGSGAAAGGAAVAGPAAGGAAVGGAAAGGAASPNMCGVGIRFAETTSGEFKITQLVPDRSAAAAASRRGGPSVCVDVACSPAPAGMPRTQCRISKDSTF
jgi:hypothetical protein